MVAPKVLNLGWYIPYTVSGVDKYRKFGNKQLTICVGDTVQFVWVNAGHAVAKASQTDWRSCKKRQFSDMVGSAKEPVADGFYSVRFNSPKTAYYYCQFMKHCSQGAHPCMVACPHDGACYVGTSPSWKLGITMGALRVCRAKD